MPRAEKSIKRFGLLASLRSAILDICKQLKSWRARKIRGERGALPVGS